LESLQQTRARPTLSMSVVCCVVIRRRDFSRVLFSSSDGDVLSMLFATYYIEFQHMMQIIDRDIHTLHLKETKQIKGGMCRFLDTFLLDAPYFSTMLVYNRI